MDAHEQERYRGLMRLKAVSTEDFVNYKNPSMFLITSFCDFKCCHEGNFDESVCQNNPLVQQKTKDISLEYLYNSYINNPITKAIVVGGLEPFLQFGELYNLIKYFRDNGCEDDFVIYTGYYKEEITSEIETLKEFPNIIIKFGRYKPNEKEHFDEILGVKLASNNQYAERIS